MWNPSMMSNFSEAVSTPETVPAGDAKKVSTIASVGFEDAGR
jgi:hypothetical protein